MGKQSHSNGNARLPVSPSPRLSLCALSPPRPAGSSLPTQLQPLTLAANRREASTTSVNLANSYSHSGGAPPVPPAAAIAAAHRAAASSGIPVCSKTWP